MSELADRVRAQLAQIKHRDDCYSELGGGSCFCDRDQQVAEAVARAIHAAGECYTDSRHGPEFCYPEALAALGEKQ